MCALAGLRPFGIYIRRLLFKRRRVRSSVNFIATIFACEFLSNYLRLQLVCNVISSFVVMRGGLLSGRPASSKLAELVVHWNVVKVFAVSPSALDATK